MFRSIVNYSTCSKAKIYFSGIQPTGIPHLGNYFGFIEPWLELQSTLPESTQMILSVVNQHAISVGPVPGKQLASDTRRMTAGLLACGVDPKRVILFRQSDVPEITQVSWILGSLQTVTKLQRMPQYKEKSSKFSKGEVPVGLLTYPLLQAADILTFKATHVPVGADQSQHMNLLTDLAYHFNKKYDADFFPIPKQVTREVSARVKSLRDPLKKMSKSDPSERGRIDLVDSTSNVLEKCKKAMTDSVGGPVTYDHENRPGVSNLIDLYSAVTRCSIEEVVQKDWDSRQLKENLGEAIDAMLQPIRERFHKLENSSEVDDVLLDGRARARNVALGNMEELRRIVGF